MQGLAPTAITAITATDICTVSCRFMSRSLAGARYVGHGHSVTSMLRSHLLRKA